MDQDQNMAENNESLPEENVKQKSKFNPKVLIIGLPLFIIQLIVVYFVTANILLTKMEGRMSAKGEKGAVTKTDEVSNADKKDTSSLGEFIYQVEDIIVNPAHTDGNKLLLSSVAFDVPNEKSKQELEKKQIVLKDAVISILSSKTIRQLSNVQYKDTLRTEISNKVKSMFSDIDINRVYFSKYIIN